MASDIISLQQARVGLAGRGRHLHLHCVFRAWSDSAARLHGHERAASPGCMHSTPNHARLIITLPTAPSHVRGGRRARSTRSQPA